MRIISCRQGTPEWFAARLGVVTASEVDALISPTWKVRDGAGVETYLCTKLCEKLLGYSPDAATTHAMDMGNLIETIALPWFTAVHETEVQRVGFCVSDDGKIGASPDGLIGTDGGIEIKSPTPPVHLKYLLRGKVSPEYLAQVHFSMYVTGRKWWKFLSFSRQFPTLLIHVERDEKIMAAIESALASFFTQFDAEFARLKADKDAENAALAAAYYKREGITP